MADIAKFIEEIKGMTVVELNELVKALEEEFGVALLLPLLWLLLPLQALLLKLWKRRRNSTSNSRTSALRRSKLSRLSVSSPPSAWLKLRLSSSPSA